MSDIGIEIKKYTPADREAWNEFVESSKNGTFLFNRDYLEYHSDRFSDHSLLFYRKNRLYCILPANLKDKTLYSHQGLTYGGLVMSRKCTAEGILEVFNALTHYIGENGWKKLVYKPVPYIYAEIPSQEDLYALFRHDARLSARNISSIIETSRPLKYTHERKSSLQRALKNHISVDESRDFKAYWQILNSNLKSKYGAVPVHTTEEMELLASRFPENIRLFTASKDSLMLGGVVCYITRQVVHCQYISASPEGKKVGAIDIVMDNLINDVFKDYQYFDMGTSNEDGGRFLNNSLIHQKEGFGGRGVCYDTYELEIK